MIKKNGKNLKSLISTVLLMLFTVSMLFVFSCTQKIDTLKVLRFGLIPTESGTKITERWKPLLDHISKCLQMKVKPYCASDYAGIIEAMRFKKIEMAYLGPKSYTDAHKRANAVAIAREQKPDGSTGYHSVIITKKGSELKTMKSLKGKTFAFNDPNSTSGYLVPITYFLKDLKVNPEEYFSRVIFSGSHEASILSVKLGKVDAAASNDLDVQRQILAGKITKKDFNIVWKSDIIPGSPLAIRGDLSGSLVKKIKDAILSFNDPKGLQKLGLKGFVETKDSDYDSIRKMKKVKESLRNQK